MYVKHKITIHCLSLKLIILSPKLEFYAEIDTHAQDNSAIVLLLTILVPALHCHAEVSGLYLSPVDWHRGVLTSKARDDVRPTCNK